MRPQRVNTVAGNNAKCRVRLVLKHRLGCDKHYITEQNVFRVNGRRAVDRCNDWHGNIDQICQHMPTLEEHLVKTSGSSKVKFCAIDFVDERFTRTRQNYGASVWVLADGAKQGNKLLVGIGIED